MRQRQSRPVENGCGNYKHKLKADALMKKWAPPSSVSRRCAPGGNHRGRAGSQTRFHLAQRQARKSGGGKGGICLRTT